MSKSNENRPNDQIDEATGTEFVGHEWDGIQELNTPLPRWWLWTFYATIVWAIVYVVLYPAWPLINNATQGVLGWSSRGELAQDIARVQDERADMVARINATPIEDLPSNPDLMQQAVSGGRAAFSISCVQCHGAGAAGYEQYGYPNLNDDDWIWGGTLSQIEHTLNHGIRWEGSDDTRIAFMPAFDGIFEKDQVNAIASHVLSLSGAGESNPAGAQLFEENCSACHQSDGAGDRAQGAPALNDAIWLYGGTLANVRQQILAPRHGVMPGWRDRLDPVTIKMLAAYVHSRGGGEEPAPALADPETNEVALATEAGDDGQS